ncbi:MAG: hypothetical protein CMH62_01005 [Nanoarchaeota archaeon]|nr:hypothetical protein [Nanoarchaeota archaeon]
MDKEIILVLMLVGLVVLGGVQAVQINDLKDNLNDGNLITGNAVNTETTQSTSVRTVTQPSMVGGC